RPGVPHSAVAAAGEVPRSRIVPAWLRDQGEDEQHRFRLGMSSLGVSPAGLARGCQLGGQLATTCASYKPFCMCGLGAPYPPWLGTFSDYRQLAYKGRPGVLSTARFWRPLWRALRLFVSTYKLLLSV